MTGYLLFLADGGSLCEHRKVVFDKTVAEGWVKSGATGHADDNWNCFEEIEVDLPPIEATVPNHPKEGLVQIDGHS
jgi:hypothetical protein